LELPTPEEPKPMPGDAFSLAMRPCTSDTPRAALTPMQFGTSVSIAAADKASRGS
jgi:hypothetical protein